MGQASTRVPDSIDEVLQEAADEIRVFRSDVIRAALVHYIRTNPPDLEAFSSGVPSRRSRPAFDPQRDL